MNRLQFARSPYLLQHRSNPVDWYPWGEEAFQEAARRDVPIFLSIGYATCHWCHVMEHESFEDQVVADLLNRHMVAIKVDREERPDIDDVYMTVCHLMGKQGGWPLTILMTPDRKPFYAGTYLPKHSRFGRIGMMDLVPRVSAMWAHQREEVVASAGEVTELLQRQAAPLRAAALAAGSGAPGGPVAAGFDGAWLDAAARDLTARYDPVYGGFGSAPKFPSPHNLNLLSRIALREDAAAGGGAAGVRNSAAGAQAPPRSDSAPASDSVSADMARDTILSMWRGGVFDQIGYGWHRYSTDSEWRLPHFEKMLHDQATMLDACVDSYLATADDRIREAGLQTAEYVLRDLRHPEGGFYSAEDADSEGEEGLFYVWRVEELESLLPAEAAEAAVSWFGMTREGNFLEEATRERTGANVLHPGSRHAAPPPELGSIQASLLEARASRIRPLRDEKVLLDWNGLMIGALARAGRAFGAPELIDAASAAHVFLRTHMRTGEGWLHRWYEGDAAVEAMLDDYAFLGAGLLELFQATSNPDCLRDAIELAESMVAYCDAPDGGFFRGSSKGETLLVRKQDWYDGAMPAGVSRAMELLLSLGALTSEPAWLDRAQALLTRAAAILGTSPGALTAFLASSARLWGEGREIVVVASTPSDALVKEALSFPLPGDISFWLPGQGEVREAIVQLLAATGTMHPAAGGAQAYVCRDFACEQPIRNAESLRAALGRTEAL